VNSASTPPGRTVTVCVAAPTHDANWVAAAPPTITLFVFPAAAATIRPLTFANVIVCPYGSVSTPARSMSTFADAASVRVSV
jgi:hypothetical protein